MSKTPFKAFGLRLKFIRERANESISDVSGAVEAEPALISKIESGEQRPSEDLVLLLINHFGLAETEAGRLWELAGYEPGEHDELPRPEAGKDQATVVIQFPDLRILYTDMVQVSANDYGLVINFMQGLGPNNQPLVISRVGMSHAHAESLIELLQQTLKSSRQAPPQLPSGENARTAEDNPSKTDRI